MMFKQVKPTRMHYLHIKHWFMAGVLILRMGARVTNEYLYTVDTMYDEDRVSYVDVLVMQYLVRFNFLIADQCSPLRDDVQDLNHLFNTTAPYWHYNPIRLKYKERAIQRRQAYMKARVI